MIFRFFDTLILQFEDSHTPWFFDLLNNLLSSDGTILVFIKFFFINYNLVTNCRNSFKLLEQSMKKMLNFQKKKKSSKNFVECHFLTIIFSVFGFDIEMVFPVFPNSSTAISSCLTFGSHFIKTGIAISKLLLYLKIFLCFGYFCILFFFSGIHSKILFGIISSN